MAWILELCLQSDNIFYIQQKKILMFKILWALILHCISWYPDYLSFRHVKPGWSISVIVAMQLQIRVGPRHACNCVWESTRLCMCADGWTISAGWWVASGEWQIQGTRCMAHDGWHTVHSWCVNEWVRDEWWVMVDDRSFTQPSSAALRGAATSL